MLRWFRERGCVHCLARDTGISQATGYRYLHEGIAVLAAQAPDLPLRFSQKHKSFGGSIQFLAAPDGTPSWVSDGEPGSTPDITAARIHVLPALYRAAADVAQRSTWPFGDTVVSADPRLGQPGLTASVAK